MSDGSIIPHYRWPGNPDRRMLAGFDTGRADLKRHHTEWLTQYVLPRALRMRRWVFLRGYASNVGDAEFNRRLSIRRAESVRRFLVEHGVQPSRVTGAGGIGEEWSQGPENDNSPDWRAVEVIVSNGVVRGEEIRVGVGSPLSRRFFIKYRGGGGGGPHFALQVQGFTIRNRHDWHVTYGWGGAGGSFGSPISLGNPLPRGRGWVSFSTSAARTVDSFEGRAYVRQLGLQVGSVGASRFILYIPELGDIEIPTGSGLSLGYEVYAGYMEPDDAGPRRNTVWRLY